MTNVNSDAIDLTELTVERVQAGFASGAFTSEKLTKAYLKRIEEFNPAYNANQIALNRTNFGAGRGVSGQARTSQGNLASDYLNQINQLANTGITNATTGSIQDMYNNLGIAQQQQGFQNQQQQEGFNNAITGATVNDALTNSAFGRALQQSTAGNANDPSQIALILSSIFGNQANAAGQGAAGAFNQAGQNSVSDPTAAIKAYLKSLGIG